MRPGHGIDPAELPTPDVLDRLASHLGLATGQEVLSLDWLPAVELPGGGRMHCPADLCLRRVMPARSSVVAPSEGMGAGRTFEAAALQGLLELIERDAAALWWIGGRRPRMIDSATLDACGLPQLLSRLRGSAGSRITHVLDITSDLGLPCVAAWSATSANSHFACGLAARPRMEDALRSALIEMCAMEINFELPGSKVPEWRRRSVPDDPILSGLEPSELRPGAPLPLVDRSLRDIGSLLHNRGLLTIAVDLTRLELGIPAVKVLVPGLQPMTTAITAERLGRTIAACGGGKLQGLGLSLL